MRLLQRVIIALALMVLLPAVTQMVAPSAAHASTSYSWTRLGNDNYWTNPANWSPNGVPGAGDSVSIAPTKYSSAPNVIVPPGTIVQSLTLGASSSLIGSGSLTITGSFDWPGSGNVMIPITVPAGGTVNISGNDEKVINSGGGNNTLNFNVAGTTTVSGTGLVLSGAGVTLTNSGTFTLQPGATMTSLSCCVNPAQFVNTGSVVLPAAGTAVIKGIAFNNSKTVSLASGSTLDLQIAPSNLNAGTSISGAGTLLVDYLASVALNGTVNLSKGTTFQLGSAGSRGSLSGTGTFTGSGSTFSWLDGMINGTFTVAKSVHTSISGNDQKTLQAPGGNGTSTLTLAGTTTLAGTGLILSGGGAILNNTGTFSPQAGSTITSGSCCVNPAQFNNKGTLTNNVGAGKTFSITYVAFYNSGTVNLKSGTLQFGNPGYTQTGGKTKLAGGSLASTSAAIVDLQGGSLSGKGTITASVQNGALIDPGSTVPGEATLTITGNYTQTSAGTLRIDIKGNGAPGKDYDQLSVSGTATLNGTLNIVTASSFTPGLSDTFTVVKATTLAGTFTTLNYKLPNNLQYYAQYTKTTATLLIKQG
jgi:hypothetical protein